MATNNSKTLFVKWLCSFKGLGKQLNNNNYFENVISENVLSNPDELQKEKKYIIKYNNILIGMMNMECFHIPELKKPTKTSLVTHEKLIFL
ncbi:MAG: hypothetical protein ACI93P_001424 [bacterium]